MGVGTRARLVAFSLVTLAIALPLVVLVAVPTSQPPGTVEPIDLQTPRGAEQRADGRSHALTTGRRRQGSGRRDRRAGVLPRRAQGPKGRTATVAAGAEAQRTPPDRAPAADSPTRGPRGVSVPREGRSPTPPGTPVSRSPAAPRESPAEGDPRPVPSEPPDPPDEAATPAAVDPLEEPEPPDGDPADEPEPADGEPLM